jgi:hypothetical protein
MPRSRTTLAARTGALMTLLAALLSGSLPAPAAGVVDRAPGAASSDGVRNAVFVGNNWDGTADIIAPGSFERLGRVDVIPDKDERMAEIAADPVRLAYFLAIRQEIGEGHDQYVDDLYSSTDGTMLIASRPSFADVVAISLATGKIVWRFPVAGYRADHMAMSPNGNRVVVSASTANVVHVLRVRDGKEVGRFASGDSPHESTFIDGGRRILHASIGMVYSPADQPELDSTKGDRVLEIVDARTFEVLRRYDLRKALDRRGLDRMSNAVRPMTVAPDDQTFYFQVSFFHGFLEMDRRTGRITRVDRLPNLVKDTPREQYLLDSAHHGIAMNSSGTKLCVAGTMDDYATVVDARTFHRGRLLRGGTKPYWVTPSRDGRTCYISWSGSDKISEISYRTGTIVRSVQVGDHPQRIRNGVVARSLVAGL